MAKITVGEKSFEANENTRLVLAIEDNGINILHRCGGYARCTTCRVRVLKGEPEKITEAEKNRLQTNNLFGAVRLSCQIQCEQDMVVEPIMILEESDVDDVGKRPEDQITPKPVWTTKSS